ncbi:hypothetical protein QDW16_gp12 [Microbacterium phage Quenya]|uniref:hypothetical protein n=1 Tax=Microbacterium phage Quenya TaxID=2776868 RepID=UPI0018A676B1|nr:hypothetical protein QDW16_gp12 [Microbacterium phage Quenya]QOP64292.1 hypothetical protein SEA_QUENYA_57 [Microbacterium phage Quenya]
MSKPTLQDYRDAGVLDHKPVPPGWLVRTAAGYQFSTPKTEEEAKRWAEKIGGTYEWYVPVQAQTVQVGETYDH